MATLQEPRCSCQTTKESRKGSQQKRQGDKEKDVFMFLQCWDSKWLTYGGVGHSQMCTGHTASVLHDTCTACMARVCSIFWTPLKAAAWASRRLQDTPAPPGTISGDQRPLYFSLIERRLMQIPSSKQMCAVSTQTTLWRSKGAHKPHAASLMRIQLMVLKPDQRQTRR